MVKKALKKGKKAQVKSKPKKVYKPTKKGHVKKQGGVKPAKVFIYTLALAALGGGGYLVYDKIRRRKFADQSQIPSDTSSDAFIINNILPSSYNSVASKALASGSDTFPLKRGTKGSRVKILQQALSKTTPSILIDGIFGSQTAGALKTAGYPESIDETLFNKITGAMNNGGIEVIFNPASLASNLYKAAQNKNLDDVILLLKQIKSVPDYSSVNDYYKKQSFISKTVVTDLLEYAFKSSESSKEQIRNEFLRMGLKVSGAGTWSLQGIRLYKDLITIRETIVTDSQNNRIPVRRNTILGDEMQVANGMTWFKSIDNSILKVPSQDVKYT